MERLINTEAPEGWSTVSPYLMVEDVKKQMDFLINVFDANFREPLITPDGSIMHVAGMICEVGIMIGKHRPGLPPITSMNYVFTEDVDEMYNKALSYGAKSLMKPVDQFYGFRECGIVDPQGNQWWIAKRTEVVSREEIRRRMDEFSK
jgi:PhnB protein